MVTGTTRARPLLRIVAEAKAFISRATSGSRSAWAEGAGCDRGASLRNRRVRVHHSGRTCAQLPDVAARHRRRGDRGSRPRSGRGCGRAIPGARIEGVGHRITGRRPGAINRHHGIGWEALHVAINDASRLAYTELLPDEKKESAP